jgi:hypothetical protein
MYNECRHIMPSGSRCHSPALRGKAYCFYHHNLHRLGDPARPEANLLVPPIEDARGIQIALSRVLTALNSPYMDTRRAGLLLYGLQIATHLTRRASAPSLDEVVRTCEEADGDTLAPEKTICEPPRDCRNCRNQDTCENYEEDEEDEEDQPEYEPEDAEEDGDDPDDDEED